MKVIVIDYNKVIDKFRINSLSNLIVYINVNLLPKKLGGSLRERVKNYINLKRKGYSIIKVD